MNPRFLLRIAAVFTAVQALGHTFGGVLGPIAPGPQTIAATAMKANAFDAFDHTRTFWDFFIGFGLCVSVFLVFEAGLLWTLGQTAPRDPSGSKAILWLLLLANIGVATLGIFFFFPAAVVSPGLNVVCVAMVLSLLQRRASQPLYAAAQQ